jgi:hypothetical protein
VNQTVCISSGADPCLQVTGSGRMLLHKRGRKRVVEDPKFLLKPASFSL